LLFISSADYSQLLCFVEVGNAYAQDQSKISCLLLLSEVGLNLSCLIYDLPITSGFHHFLHTCCMLIDKLEINEQLGRNLVGVYILYIKLECSFDFPFSESIYFNYIIVK